VDCFQPFCFLIITFAKVYPNFGLTAEPSVYQSNMSTAPGDEFQPGTEGIEAAHAADTTQNDYKSRTGQSHIPVVGDDSNIEDPINANTADSDDQLGMCYLQFQHIRRGC
jgi:hypothetical protein